MALLGAAIARDRPPRRGRVKQPRSAPCSGSHEGTARRPAPRTCRSAGCWGRARGPSDASLPRDSRGARRPSQAGHARRRRRAVDQLLARRLRGLYTPPGEGYWYGLGPRSWPPCGPARAARPPPPSGGTPRDLGTPGIAARPSSSGSWVGSRCSRTAPGEAMSGTLRSCRRARPLTDDLARASPAAGGATPRRQSRAGGRAALPAASSGARARRSISTPRRWSRLSRSRETPAVPTRRDVRYLIP